MNIIFCRNLQILTLDIFVFLSRVEKIIPFTNIEYGTYVMKDVMKTPRRKTNYICILNLLRKPKTLQNI